MPSRQAEALEFLESAYLEKIMETFNFLDHCHDVNELLKVCVEILPTLSPEHQAKLTTELRTFEDFVVPTMWGIGDVENRSDDDDDETEAPELSDDDKRCILNAFSADYECKQSDWDALQREVQEFLENSAA